MICRRCLLRASKQQTTSSIRHRQPFSQSSVRRAQQVTAETTTSTNPRPNDLPAAPSTSAAQPFSTPLSHSPENISDLPIERKQKKDVARVESSVPAGTVLKGINFMKNAQDPIALEDGEYPAWLWSVLDKKDGAKDGEDAGEGDLFSKSKKQRRKAAKALRKQQKLHPELLQPKIPLHEQSIDLPAGNGTVEGARQAGEARGDLTKALRQERKRKIKEGNFLKAMG